MSLDNTMSNTQAKQLTTSDNGTNVRPVLVCDSHFFIESLGAGSFSQTSSQKFGVVSQTQFRTSAKVSFSGKKSVFAICQGQVFVQPQAGSTTKVNLILRPYRQPIRELPIKYFIYRGLDKSDFISGTGESALVAGSETNGSGFVKHIWTEFNKFYKNEKLKDNPPQFLAKMIGFSDGVDQTVDTLIDTFFYKITRYTDATKQEETSETSFELPLIPKGIQLGSAENEIAIDVVLNRGDHFTINSVNPFKLDLSYARASEYLLDTANGDTDYKKKLTKEASTQFIDIAAFYGLHCNAVTKLYYNNEAEPLKLKEDIYEHLQNFNSKNTQYLYIQSNRQRSYNFYNNYNYNSTNNNDFMVGVSEDNLTETSFGELGWPVHTLDNNENTFFKLTTDNHNNAGMFVSLGSLITNNEQNFVRNANLLQTATENENTTIDINYTKSIGFKAELVGSDAIVQCVFIVYEGKQMIVDEYVDPPQPGEQPKEPEQFLIKDIDDVFGMINEQSFIQIKDGVEEMASLLDEQLQIINFPNAQAETDIGVVKTRRITDAIKINDNENIKRVTYETLLTSARNENNIYVKNNSSSIAKASANTVSFSKEQNNFYQPSQPYYFKTKLFTDNGQTITGLILETNDGSTPTKKILGLTKEENQLIKSLIINNNLLNPKMYFKNLLTDKTDNFVSIENQNYKKYSLSIVAENTLGNINIHQLVKKIYVFSIDGLAFTSHKYGESLPNLTITLYSNLETIEE